MIKFVIFDVDGTILDTEKIMLQSLQDVLREEGKDYAQEELRFALGIPGKETLKKLKVSDIDRVHSRWVQLVSEYSKEVKMFDGLKEVIEALSSSSIRIGIVTSKTKQELINEFEPLEISRHFECVVCSSDTENHKPHPEPLLVCLERLHAASSEALYIGDSIYDMQCAKSACVKFALALWGSKKTEGFELADVILKEPKDIWELINK